MSTDTILLSVVLLTYNHERYIEQCLESIVRQKTNFAYNIIIGDDASTDATQKIINEYAQQYPNIIPICRKHNIGAVSNLVDLLKRTQAKYIAGCEGDDFWTDEFKLQKQVDFLENRAGYSAVSHDIIIVDENNEIVERELSWIAKEREFTWQDFRGIYLPGHPVALVFRHIFTGDIQADILKQMHEQIADRTLALLLSLKGNIYRLPDTMAAYRIRRYPTKKADNMTGMIYAETDYYMDEYLFTLRLQELATLIKHQTIRFLKFRTQLVFRSFCKILLYPTRKRWSNWLKLFTLYCKEIFK